jgi:hypothetical protein
MTINYDNDYQLARLTDIKSVSAGWNKYDVQWMIKEIERMRAALLRIESWDFAIMGDGVADAQRLAHDTLHFADD